MVLAHRVESLTRRPRRSPSIHFIELLARFVGPQVRMNAVAPGLVDMPVTETWAARYVTGQVLLVGGELGLLR